MSFESFLRLEHLDSPASEIEIIIQSGQVDFINSYWNQYIAN